MKGLRHSCFFENRGILGFLLLFPIGLAVSFSTPMIPEDSFMDSVMDSLGWGLFLTYASFRLWATMYIGGRKDKQLQTEGPYSITRNPLYLGSFCFALSVACFFDSISLLLMVSFASGIYLHLVVKDEEVYMENKFGSEFKEYCQRTPRFIPSIFRYYHSEDSINVNLPAMKSEAKRLWRAALLPILAEIIMHFRAAPWWPHWFTLP